MKKDKTAAPPVIAIDGPAAAGKGTIAAEVAAMLGFHLLESGRLYRALALFAKRRGVDLQDEDALAAAAKDLAASPPLKRKILAAPQIDAADTGEDASAISRFAAVRKGLLDLQRASRRPPGLVAEGRDMGSVVFTDAAVKIYLFAPAAIRAKRRALQLRATGRDVRIADVLADLRRRDMRDCKRANAPLAKSADAKRINCGTLSAAAAAKKIVSLYRRESGGGDA